MDVMVENALYRRQFADHLKQQHGTLKTPLLLMAKSVNRKLLNKPLPFVVDSSRNLQYLLEVFRLKLQLVGNVNQHTSLFLTCGNILLSDYNATVGDMLQKYGSKDGWLILSVASENSF